LGNTLGGNQRSREGKQPLLLIRIQEVQGGKIANIQYHSGATLKGKDLGVGQKWWPKVHDVNALLSRLYPAHKRG
jgi:hypothetical protein